MCLACHLTKTITIINYDCLERIFDFLDFEWLLNCVGTCKRLQIAAAAKFGDDFGKKSVWMSHGIPSIGGTPGLFERRDELIVFGMKWCFLLLRCFGKKISLDIWYKSDTTATKNAHLHRYINEYCARTLKSISILFYQNFSIENFSKPFEKVEKVTLRIDHVENQLPKLVRLFPNSRHLELLQYISIDENAIAVSFPHLEHLSISVNHDGTSFGNEKLLRANRQLQSLKIHLEYSNQFRQALGFDQWKPIYFEMANRCRSHWSERGWSEPIGERAFIDRRADFYWSSIWIYSWWCHDAHSLIKRIETHWISSWKPIWMRSLTEPIGWKMETQCFDWIS